MAVLGTLLLVVSWWMISARKWFKAPIAQGTEDELAQIERRYGEEGEAEPLPAS